MLCCLCVLSRPWRDVCHQRRSSDCSLQDATLEFLRKFTIGLLSGTISSCVNIPFDVAKSRIQGPQPQPGQIKYRTCLQTMALVYREEGYEPGGVHVITQVHVRMWSLSWAVVQRLPSGAMPAARDECFVGSGLRLSASPCWTALMFGGRR